MPYDAAVGAACAWLVDVEARADRAPPGAGHWLTIGTCSDALPGPRDSEKLWPERIGEVGPDGSASEIWRSHPDLNWGMVVLQTTALPLGYGTEGAFCTKRRW